MWGMPVQKTQEKEGGKVAYRSEKCRSRQRSEPVIGEEGKVRDASQRGYSGRERRETSGDN